MKTAVRTVKSKLFHQTAAAGLNVLPEIGDLIMRTSARFMNPDWVEADLIGIFRKSKNKLKREGLIAIKIIFLSHDTFSTRMSFRRVEEQIYRKQLEKY